jgi:hypothetical protein
VIREKKHIFYFRTSALQLYIYFRTSALQLYIYFRTSALQLYTTIIVAIPYIRAEELKS